AAARLGELPAALAECRTANDVRARLGEIATPPAPGRLPAARPWIDRGYAARAALANILTKSPTSLKVTLRNLRSAVSFSRVEQSFQQDYRIALACIAGHDFIEGIRATIVDKDRNPAWRPDRPEDVTKEIVDRHFRPVGKLELTFDD